MREERVTVIHDVAGIARRIAEIEPVAIIRRQGIKIKNYYTAYQANIYGIAVPEDSAIKTFADLKGKKIGVTSMASAGVIVARALAADTASIPTRISRSWWRARRRRPRRCCAPIRSTRSRSSTRNMR